MALGLLVSSAVANVAFDVAPGQFLAAMRTTATSGDILRGLAASLVYALPLALLGSSAARYLARGRR